MVQGVVLEQEHAQGLAVRDQLHFDLVLLVTVLEASRGAVRGGMRHRLHNRWPSCDM